MVFGDGEYGRFEAIYKLNEGSTNTFSFVSDPKVMGTLNYSSGRIGHAVTDVIPYWIWGNSPKDPTNWWERFTRTFD